jgi:hypothetical protein
MACAAARLAPTARRSTLVSLALRRWRESFEIDNVILRRLQLSVDLSEASESIAESASVEPQLTPER